MPSTCPALIFSVTKCYTEQPSQLRPTTVVHLIRQCSVRERSDDLC